eukprot:COSAG01_NODE_5114_length_4474_cov_12.268114_1_plen_69_part_00
MLRRLLLLPLLRPMPVYLPQHQLLRLYSLCARQLLLRWRRLLPVAVGDLVHSELLLQVHQARNDGGSR